MVREKGQMALPKRGDIVCLFSGGCGERGEDLFMGGIRGQEEIIPGETKEEEPQSHTPETAEDQSISVYVCGAVVSPGVVEIPGGSRAEDALRAAGGFREDAGRTAVNLADWVTDGQMLYFPTEEEAVNPVAGEGEPGLVNINTADSAALCTLPGVGEGKAADIISYREANGPFENCEDIMKVPGIKTAAYEKIRDMITVK